MIGTLIAMPDASETAQSRRWPEIDPFDLAAMLLLVALLVAVPLLVSDYAVSNDEGAQHRYGELILAYYASGFTDLSVFRFQNLHLYGGLLDITAVLLARFVPADVYLIRHVLCAVIGIGGIAAAWATARLVAGPRAGALAAASLAVCGPWIGSMFNHTKDIPFAAAMMGATYFLLRAARDLPRPGLHHLFGFSVLLGAALGQRAMGLVLPVYALLAIILHVPKPFTPATATRFVARSLVLFVPAFALGYLIMIAAWPWAALSLINPVRAMFTLAHTDYSVQTLFAGRVYSMDDVPRWYVPVYLAIKLPLVMLTGAALAMVLTAIAPRAGASDSQPTRRHETWFIACTALLPVAGQFVAQGPAFSGMRQFLFVAPPLAVLAGIGFDAALDWLERRRRALAMAAAVLVGVWFVWTANTLVRLHPYEYVYFNPIVGGLSGAYRHYDTDYWVNVMHEAVARLEKILDGESLPDTRPFYHVAVCGERLAFEKEAAVHARLRWARDQDPADFYIAPTHLNCDAAVDGEIFVSITRLGVPLGVVKDRRAMTKPEVVFGW
jgi:hypothetical protein